MEFNPTIQESRWQPATEIELAEKWEKERLYRFRRRLRKKFIIDTPPPYPSGRPWHIGAAAQYSQIDMISRTARFLGYEVLFPIGIDRNGLPVEIFTEKKLGVSMKSVPREEFIRLCSKALDELEAEMLSIMRRMGLSGDFRNYYRTDSAEYRALTQSTFIQLWYKGLVYEAVRPNNYCPECGTVIADAEVEHEPRPSDLAYINFEVPGKGQLTVATTRPELLCSCKAVIVNPLDERFSEVQGQRAVVPIYGTAVPILPHPAARPEFGSGAVMVCSYGDQMDVQLFRELGLEPVIAIGEDGRMTSSSGFLEGMDISEARQAVIRELASKGLLVKVDDIIHDTPICERSKNPIEIIPMKEFYLRQVEFRDRLVKLIEKMKFHPNRSRQLLLDWIMSLRIDWPISRRRYYATEIPVWRCKRCGEAHLPRPGRYYRPWRDKAPFKRCKACGSDEFVGEERTFDTWMDSSISPIFVIMDKHRRRVDRRLYPLSLRPQGKDIVRTWLHYTILRCYQLTGKEPFKHVWIAGLGLDERGEKMSKSKGNVIDPSPILERYGADGFRFWNAQESNLGEDFRVSEARIAGAAKFLTKLWNVARYVSSFPQPSTARLTPTDRWILSELSQLVETCLAGYQDFNFFVPATSVRDFVWNTFASHYLEMSKPRAYALGFSRKEQEAAWKTLHTCLSVCLRLMAPITPFITDTLWRHLYGRKSIHLQTFPKPAWPKTYVSKTVAIKHFNSTVWGLKKSRGISLKAPITYEVPVELSPFRRDLVAMHRIVEQSGVPVQG